MCSLPGGGAGPPLGTEEAKVSLEVALLQIKLRTDQSTPLPSAEHVKALQAASPILLEEQLVKPGTNLNQVITDLVDTQFARSQLAGEQMGRQLELLPARCPLCPHKEFF